MEVPTDLKSYLVEFPTALTATTETNDVNGFILEGIKGAKLSTAGFDEQLPVAELMSQKV